MSGIGKGRASPGDRAVSRNRAPRYTAGKPASPNLINMIAHHSRPRRTKQLIIPIVLTLLAACGKPAPPVYHEARPLMGTVVELTLAGPDQAALRRAANAAWAEMDRLSTMMNHYNPDSVVSAINNAAGKHPVTVPPELMNVLKSAQSVSVRSDGAFDITVGGLRGWRFDPMNPAMPDARTLAAERAHVDYRRLRLDEKAGSAYLSGRGMRIDLGGIAKLPILNAGMKVLRRHGVTHALINGGGDVVALGGGPDRHWYIGVRHPRKSGELLGVLAVTDGYVVTSGDYERYFIKDGRRYHHILDPRTGLPTTGPQQVTLLADQLDTVNGLSAAIMVMGGERGRAMIEATPGLEGLIVGRDGKIWMSPGMRERLKPAK